MTGALQVTGAITATTTLNAATVNVSGLSANGVIVADGAKNLISVAPSTSGNVLMSNGTSWASTTPAYFNQTCNVGYYLRGFDASGNKVCTSIHAELTISKTADGYLNSCAIMSDTSLVCWGYNGVGQLGDGTQTAAPNDLEHYVRGSDGMAITGVTDVTSAEQHTCIVKSDGTVWCWGQNNTGQLGIGNLTNTFNPTQVINLTSATQVSAGEAGTCALRADGSVFCWGYGAYGQMGVNTTTANNSTPIQVSGITSATAVSMGGQNVCALLSDQTMKCWGLNIVGALGDGTATERNTPVAVINMTGITQMSTSPASAGASYYGHTCAMKSNGTVWCWGYNPNGELGTGNTTNQSTPTQTLGITTAVSLAVGYGTNCAVLADGTAKCWGYNGTYAVGDGTATSRTTPTLVIGIGGAATLTGITAISISRAQSGSAGAHAITNTGAVYAWGPNSQGQLGNGTTTASMSPVGVRY